MLYKKIVAVSLTVYAFFSRTAFAETYEYFVSTGGTNCDEAISTDECIYHCDESGSNARTFNCGNAGICSAFCEQKQCLADGNLTASNSGHLNVYGIGAECFRYATVQVPNNGDAYFYDPVASTEKSFRRMTVNAGTNTGSIYIDCSGRDKEECRFLQVNAQTANYLQIDVGPEINCCGLFDQVTVYCPENVNETPPTVAPCIINATTADLNRLTSVNIYTLNGIPSDVWIFDGGNDVYDDVTIWVTNKGCSTNLNQAFTKTTAGSCAWNTDAPTLNPTIDPTVNPTINPTNPSLNPTKNPSNNPSLTPTKPSMNPSISPTDIPSILPSNNPSAVPSNNPSTVPTKGPTNNPSKLPTLSPTYNDKPIETESITTTELLKETVDKVGNDNLAAESDNDQNLIIIILSIVSGLLCLIIVTYIVYKKVQNKKLKADTNGIQMSKTMKSVSTDENENEANNNNQDDDINGLISKDANYVNNVISNDVNVDNQINEEGNDVFMNRKSDESDDELYTDQKITHGNNQINVNMNMVTPKDDSSQSSESIIGPSTITKTPDH